MHLSALQQCSFFTALLIRAQRASMSAALDTQSIQTRSSRWCKNPGRTASGKVIVLQFNSVCQNSVALLSWGENIFNNNNKNEIYEIIYQSPHFNIKVLET